MARKSHSFRLVNPKKGTVEGVLKFFGGSAKKAEAKARGFARNHGISFQANPGRVEQLTQAIRVMLRGTKIKHPSSDLKEARQRLAQLLSRRRSGEILNEDEVRSALSAAGRALSAMGLQQRPSGDLNNPFDSGRRNRRRRRTRRPGKKQRRRR